VNKASSPKFFRYVDGSDLQICPPSGFIAMLMQFMMMFTAQRNSEFIADFSSKSLWLRKFEMVRVTGRALADQARLRGYKR
jgi:hypothetical protein